MPGTEQRRAALEVANAKRSAIAAMRVHVQSGRVSLPDLFLDPPDFLSDYALIDVMQLARPRGGKGKGWQEKIGRWAVRDGVNVLVPLGKASQASREWAAKVSPVVSPAVARRRREFEKERRVCADLLVGS